MNPVRVRFAPSPTGPLHIGGLRTALYNYLFARKNNGTFILRIEDTDQSRLVPGADEYIIDSLNWCRIPFDEGPGNEGGYEPYRQSERKNIYRQYAEKLVSAGHAYYAFDSADELEQMRKRLKDAGAKNQQYDSISRMQMKNSITLPEGDVKRRIDAGEPYVIRIKIPSGETVTFKDLIHGTVAIHTFDLDDKVIYKSDGMPTYHLANVVDDYLMKISHVIRGDEWLPSTPLHVLLYRFLGWEDAMPQFAHLPLILRPDGNGKLSKRDGDRLGFPVFPLTWKDPATGEVSEGFRARGYFPEAVMNFIAFLGWNPGTEQELFTREELIDAFSLDSVQKAGARFDNEKAKWFNQQYLHRKTDDELSRMLSPFLPEKKIHYSNDFLKNVCRLMKERVSFPHEIISHGDYFFSAPVISDLKAVEKKIKPGIKSLIEELVNRINRLTVFSSEEIDNMIKGFIAEKNINTAELLPVLRYFITGTSGGPSVHEIMSVLGKNEAVNRLNTGLQLIILP
ncbi:MAG: glutamate--tRNA ligase [Bacteroidetes bacterium]|nr:glutamate--tRNA ligase [Bacteroidota bacterium]